MTRGYHFNRARRADRALANESGKRAAEAAMVAIQKRDLDTAKCLYDAAAEHFKAAGLTERQAQYEKAAAFLDGYMTRKAG